MTLVFVVLLVVMLALCLWVVWIEPRYYAIRRFDVQLVNLKTPIRAVVIGDLQPNAFHWPTRRLKAVFSKVYEAEVPDLTLWLGDYYNGHTGASGAFLAKHPKLTAWVESKYPKMDEIASAMSYLPGKIGSFAVLGNHDWAWSGEKTAQLLEAQGIKVLRDQVVDILDTETGNSIQVLGYEDISSRRIPNYEKVHKGLKRKAAQIAISHSPDAFPEALGGPALMLAGHTHGGQIRLPFLGALVLPIRYTQYDRGWFAERHRRLYVTTGLGTSLPPFRFLCRPEIVVLNLIPERKDP